MLKTIQKWSLELWKESLPMILLIVGVVFILTPVLGAGIAFGPIYGFVAAGFLGSILICGLIWYGGFLGV